MNTLRNTMGALAFAALIFGAIRCTGEPSDVEALADMAMNYDDAVIEARLDAMARTEQERLAWRICKSMHAERAQVYALADTGEFVCRRIGSDL